MIRSVEQILYGYYIKYSKMKDLTLQAFSGSEADNVNIYIDLNNMLGSIYNDTLSSPSYMTITSSVINLCAHIRDYYLRNHRVYTTIYLVYSHGDSVSRSNFYYGYNRSINNNKTQNPKTHKMVLDNIGLIDTIVKYLDKIYLINKMADSDVLIYDQISYNLSIGNIYPSIVFSRDVLAFQIPAIIPNCVLFRPSKKAGEDLSYMVNTSDSLIKYIKTTREATSIDPLTLSAINPELLSVLMAITNIPSHNVKSVYNIRIAVNMILSALDKLSLPNGHTYPQTVTQFQSPNLAENVEARYKAIDLIHQHLIYTNTPEYLDRAYLIDLIDDNAVRAINNKYFKTNPLDLNRL